MRKEIHEVLVGKTIVSHELKDDGSQLKLNCSDGTAVKLETEGDCCSFSWIESIDAPEALLGTVVSVEDIDMPNLGNIDGTRHQGVDEVAYYGLKITTEKGRCVIDYRNDSNGYYGGWIYLAGIEPVAP